MATKIITIVAPPSLTSQTVTVNVVVPDPVVTNPAPVVTLGTITETHSITGTTAPPPAPPPPAAHVRANLIINNPFDGVTPFAGLSVQPPNRISVTTERSRVGTKSIKVTVNKTDPHIGNSLRSELNLPTTFEPFVEGIHRWYGISHLFPASYVSDKAPEAIIQWHEFGGSDSPHFAIWTISKHIWIAINGVKAIDLGEYLFDTWVDFVFHFRWSKGASGLIEMWKDDVKVSQTYTGQNVPSADAYLPYVKFGVYKWPWKPGNEGYGSTTSSRTLYIDEFRVGNNSAVKDNVTPG